jgi:hypothetical protein
MKDIKIKIEELDYTKPIKYYCKIYDLSLNALRNRFKKLNIYKNFVFTKGNTSKIHSYFLENEYLKNPSKCINCQIDLLFKKRKNKYCSIKCASIHTQKDGGHCHWSKEERKKRSIWAKKYGYRPEKKRIQKICEYCKVIFEIRPCHNHRRFCNPNCRTSWFNKTGYLKGKLGGYRKNSGRGKQGWYKGYYCQSSWELAWVIYQLEHKINFRRNNQGFEYEFENKKYKFYPDFILDDDNYVEIKGYMTEKNKSKFLNFPHKLYIIGKNDIKQYIEYVQNKYGKNFINLYEKM